MLKAIKPISIFTVLFICFLFVSEMPEIGAQDTDCLQEYGGNVGFAFCMPRIFPTICYRNCRMFKEAKGGHCMSDESGIKCLCDFCSDSPYLIKL